MDLVAFDLVRQLAASQYLVRSLHVAAELGVADAVEDAGTAVTAVAAQIGADADALGRVLRLLASRGVFALGTDGVVRHSAASKLLRRDDPASLLPFVRMFAQPIHWQSAGALASAVRSGRASVGEVFPDGGFWGYYERRPEEGRVFDAAMAAKSAAQIGAVIAGHDFSQYRRLVDIGGGQGHLLRAILAAHRGVEGVLFDLPPVIEAAQAMAPAERLSFVGGDFFADALPGGEAIVLMEVLHDWDDADCARILRAVHAAGKPGTKLLVIEIEMTSGDGPDWPKLLDIVMLAVFGARQRTGAEYRALLEANGFRLTGATTTAGVAIYEAAWA